MMEMKVGSRIVVPREDVERYYNENPEYDERELQLQIAFIARNPLQSEQEQQDVLREQCKAKKEACLPWREPVWLKESDISEERSFILSMKSGEVSEPLVLPNGFEIIRIVAIKEPSLIPLERRYKKIVSTLRKPQYTKLLEEYESELRKNAHIVMLDSR
jgi:hypothetical protein